MNHDKLPTENSEPIEKIVVIESGDESEDEWAYIKSNKKEEPEEEQIAPVAEHEENHSTAVADNINIHSPTPPTASPEETEVINQESHALAQAIAQPEEACSELHEEKQDNCDFEVEQVERSVSVEAEHDSDLGNEEDLDDMDSQLNPDAKEFIPTSPQRTNDMESPFANGIHTRIDLIEDDVVSQSPRKGSTVVMDDKDIILPCENDFSEISKCPSELVANELDFECEQIENGNVDIDVVKDTLRPESSSSQFSYQEMNLKEAMHGDEKQEFAAELQETENPFAGGDNICAANGGEQISAFLNEKDPMNMSFYNGENNPFNSGEVDMNAVQPLPDDGEDESEDNDMINFISQPVEIEHNVDPNITNELNGRDELEKEFLCENEKLISNEEYESNIQEQLIITSEHNEQTPITNFVQELATEVTSILHDVNSHESLSNSFEAQPNVYAEAENVTVMDYDQPIPDAFIVNSELSVEASEFTPTRFDESIQIEQTNDMEIQQIQHEIEELKLDATNVQNEENIIEKTDDKLSCIEEGDVVAEATVATAAAATAAAAEAAATVAAVSSSSVNEPTNVIKNNVQTAQQKIRPVDSKKPTDAKSRAVPNKKTPSTTSTATPITSTKSITRPTSVRDSKESALKSATRAAPRTVVEKKISNTTLNRKPLSNGTTATVPSAAKKPTTTTTTAAPSKVANVRQTTASKTASTTRTSVLTATKTAVPKTSTGSAAPRVPLTNRVTAKPTTTTAKTATTTRTTSTTNVISSTRVKSAPSTARPTALKAKVSVDKLGVPKIGTKLSPTKTPSASPLKLPLNTTKSPIAKTSTTGVGKTPPTRKPIAVSKVAPIKSPKVPATNGVAKRLSKISNDTNNVNGHNGSAGDKIIDVSAD